MTTRSVAPASSTPWRTRSANLAPVAVRGMRQGYNRRVARFADILRSPFSFLFARSASEERLATYVLREHERGRALAEILDDPYIRNRTTPQERSRILDRPEIVRALGEDVVESTRAGPASR